jgi:hypothetical protein
MNNGVILDFSNLSFRIGEEILSLNKENEKCIVDELFFKSICCVTEVKDIVEVKIYLK